MQVNDTATVESPATSAENDGWEWAIIEIMGHRKHAGRIREEERFGAKMLRIDIPTFPATRIALDAADAWREAPREIVWATHYYGGSALFSYTLTDEATVMKANKPYESPYRMRLPAPPEDDDLPFDDGGPYNEGGDR